VVWTSKYRDRKTFLVARARERGFGAQDASSALFEAAAKQVPDIRQVFVGTFL
jgi:hypothetical protein